MDLLAMVLEGSKAELNEQQAIDYAIALSLSEQDRKGKKSIDKQLARAQTKEDEHIAKAQLEDDEQLAKALQESMYMESPPRCETENIFQPYPFNFPSECRICARCNTEIGHGEFLICMGADWHPECFRCHACSRPITDGEVKFSISDNRSYHKLCYKKPRHPRCEVCKNFIPANSEGVIPYREHRFWKNKYCPSHEHDGTPRCCSCERMEEFYEGLNMKVEQQVPMLLVERQALNEAMEGEKNGHHQLSEIRGLCLSEVQTVPTISRRPRIGADYQFIGMRTEPYRLIRRCEVTAILILYGLPRLLTGVILAHEMMHAWLKLKGYRNLSPEVEEGICQVLAYMWLESELYTASGSDVVSSTSSSSSSLYFSSSSFTSSKKGKRSDFEKRCGEFFKHHIELDASPAYGDGFRTGRQAVDKYGLKNTLDHIRLTGSFP
ncbi:protein DA1-related 1-like isoform X3 [Juglans microcarpa x Juglans regia]|uniref:protein DA1-related 1-like isoform X3 n=1 Tax=Juglans microcarpa x Juglans regia TaxID=2249226 RepID=UPI001B7E079E|nr:protein DA1-related 1-like isoform X3 [Juglans microcarpa x Juglans regia]